MVGIAVAQAAMVVVVFLAAVFVVTGRGIGSTRADVDGMDDGS